jgi:hypothetical protein
MALDTKNGLKTKMRYDREAKPDWVRVEYLNEIVARKRVAWFTRLASPRLS